MRAINSPEEGPQPERPAQLIFFAVVVTAAFAVRGTTGFGSAAVAVPLAALLISVTALPFMMLGAKLGDAIAARVDQHAFNRIVGGVLLVSGAVLVLK